MAFRFRLQPLLDHRARIAEEKLRELGRAEAAYRAQLAELARIEAELEQNDEKIRQPGPRSAAMLQLQGNYKNHLKLMALHQKSRISEAEAVVANKREAVRVATLEKKTLEVLKERKIAEYEERLQLLENRDLDDSNIGLTENRRRERRLNDDQNLSA